MSHQAEESLVEAQTTYKTPEDWPLDGPIDLAVHDLPHASSSLEWWYVNSHIRTKEGKHYSLFASFFRKLLSYDEETKELNYGHSVTWAIYDADEKEYFPVSFVDKRSPEIGLEKLRNGEVTKDPRMRKAAIEMMEKGNMPYPDQLFKGDINVSLTCLDLDFDGHTFVKQEDGSYSLYLYEPELKVGCEVQFFPKKTVIRHGENGVVKGVSGEDMFYYFIPRCEVKGSICVKDQWMEIADADGWYDHEFGRHPGDETGDYVKDIAWNWFSGQFENNWELTCYELFNNDDGGKECGRRLLLISPDGERKEIDDFVVTPLNNWTSMRTFNDYPTQWSVTSKSADLDLKISAPHDQQEFITAISKPAFWEGKVDYEGKIWGETVEGSGFLERSGFEDRETLDEFFKKVSRETLRSIRKFLPKDPSRKKLNQIVAHEDKPEFADGVDGKQLSKALIEPIREIIDRGGKSWRSYAALACCDIVGGNSQPVRDWLALPELMHVGSLIVDDVEDKSVIRRGGPPAHELYGEAIAINAGCAAYFIGEVVVYQAEITDKQKVEIYNLYFEGLRAAHAGQALDLAGLAYLLPEAVETGDSTELQTRILAIHKLKSAVPASLLAQVGATLGGGSDEQSEGLGQFYRGLGISFQIKDDVLNLRGFKGDLKNKGEDLSEGKVTYPVAKALSMLELPERRRLAEILEMKTTDVKLLAEAIKLIEDCGAFDACDTEAVTIIDRAWKKLDPLVRDSYVKMMLRAFSWYVLDRQY